jgi:FemAB-related protein (PEP-CTERM system-associated)
MKIEISRDIPDGWDDYVAGHPAATAYHTSGAALIANSAFGLRTYFLTASGDDGGISGTLPIVEQSSLVFGRFHSSLPFVTYGGALSDNECVTRELAARAGELARSRNARHVELRHRKATTGLSLPERNDKVSMVLRLPGDEDALAKTLGSKLRSQIRRAEREDPEVIWGREELIGDFYSVFAPSMHGLGTPVYPRSFFEVVLTAMGDRASIIVVRVKGKPEGAALTVRHGAEIEVPWAAASLWGKRNAINMRMYWEMLRSATIAGAGAFDFGRSTVDSGTYRFKKQWGAEPVDLHWCYWLPDGGSIPKLNHSNPKYQLAIRAWQRMPLWCANLIGPRISRNLP